MDLPFGKRPLNDRPVPPATPPGVFGQLTFHTPINHQTLIDRQHQEGSLRQASLKTPTKGVDGRVDQVDRNRSNMFSIIGTRTSEMTRTRSPTLAQCTRHNATPYSYSTYWMSHPPSDTSLGPLKSEAYLTSFMSTDIADKDKAIRTKTRQSRCDSKRYHEEDAMHRIDDRHERAVRAQDRTVKDIRAQREVYQKALEARQKLEKIHSFE